MAKPIWLAQLTNIKPHIGESPLRVSRGRKARRTLKASNLLCLVGAEN